MMVSVELNVRLQVFQLQTRRKQAGAELCQAQDKLEVIVYIGLKVEFELRCSYELRCSNELRCSYEYI